MDGATNIKVVLYLNLLSTPKLLELIKSQWLTIISYIVLNVTCLVNFHLSKLKKKAKDSGLCQE